jgi:hypothetical protein
LVARGNFQQKQDTAKPAHRKTSTPQNQHTAKPAHRKTSTLQLPTHDVIPNRRKAPVRNLLSVASASA